MSAASTKEVTEEGHKVTTVVEGTAATAAPPAMTGRILTEPWSKRHKEVTRNDREGLKYNLSNSFAQPTSVEEVEKLAAKRGDDALVRAYRDHSLSYTPNGGSSDCREAVSEAIFDTCKGDDVLVTAGGQVALQTVCFALLGRGDHAVVCTPSYQSCQEAPLHAGASVTKVRLTQEWDLDLAALEAACTKNTKLILLNQPWNPGGTLISRDTFEAVLDIAKKSGAWILNDEIYRFLEYDGRKRLPAVADLYERGISIGALSKAFGAGGLSLGWIACRDIKTLQRCKDAQYFGTACVARSSELLAIMVLRASERLLQRNLGIIRRNLKVLEAFLKRNSDLFSYVKPVAGCVLFAEFKGPMTAADLGEQLAASGISVKPSYCFTQDPRDGQYVRLGFGEDKLVPLAIEALAKFIDEKRSGWGCPRK